ncbi:hypothetical protein [Staphylococcus warneri]
MQIEASLRKLEQKNNETNSNILEVPEKFESEIKNEDESVSQNDSDNN